MERRKFMLQGTGSLLSVVLSAPYNNFSKMKIMKNPKFKTPLCDLLNITYPIVQAGMGDVAGPELVAAVSNAGGLGILSGTMVPPDVLQNNIRKIRSLTNRPFGVNLLLQQDIYPPREYDLSDEVVNHVQEVLNRFRTVLDLPQSNAKPEKLPPLIQKAFEIIVEEKVPVFSIGLGNPSQEMVSLCKHNNILVMAMVCTVEDAIAVEKSGVDIIVAQGSEAGGHRSTWTKKASNEYASIGTMALVPQIVEKVKIPVIAAGGIATGEAMVAAIQLGAQGVMIGTRFVATHESIAPACYKQKIVESSSDHTTVTDVFTGMYARVVRNDFTEQYAAAKAPVLPPGRQLMAAIDIIKTAAAKQNSNYYTLYSGQGIDHITGILSAKEVVEQLIEEALTCLESVGKRIQT